jgi:hypothetical protein
MFVAVVVDVYNSMYNYIHIRYKLWAMYVSNSYCRSSKQEKTCQLISLY